MMPNQSLERVAVPPANFLAETDGAVQVANWRWLGFFRPGGVTRFGS